MVKKLRAVSSKYNDKHNHGCKPWHKIIECQILDQVNWCQTSRCWGKLILWTTRNLVLSKTPARYTTTALFYISTKTEVDERLGFPVTRVKDKSFPWKFCVVQSYTDVDIFYNWPIRRLLFLLDFPKDSSMSKCQLNYLLLSSWSVCQHELEMCATDVYWFFTKAEVFYHI